MVVNDLVEFSIVARDPPLLRLTGLGRLPYNMGTAATSAESSRQPPEEIPMTKSELLVTNKSLHIKSHHTRAAQVFTPRQRIHTIQLAYADHLAGAPSHSTSM